MVICGVIAELTLGMKNPELEGPEAPDPEFSSSRSLSYFDRCWHRTEYGSPSVSSEEHETQWNRAGSTPSRQTLRTSALYVILGKNFGPKFFTPSPLRSWLWDVNVVHSIGSEPVFPLQGSCKDN